MNVFSPRRKPLAQAKPKGWKKLLPALTGVDGCSVGGSGAARSWQGDAKTDEKNPVIGKTGIAFHAAAKIPIVHKRTAS